MSASSVWLVSARFDLAAFGLPALLALVLVPFGPWIAPTGETPLPMWVIAVLMIDVAHVWSTIYRTYGDPAEVARRPGLYVGVPSVVYVLGAVLAAWSWSAFWTVLAYLAVYHFVRQQYGWVALYNRTDPDVGAWERRIDTVAIYASTLFPLVWWHAHLPRKFHWFLPGDFLGIEMNDGVLTVLWLTYGLALLAFFIVQLARAVRDGPRWGKVIVVASTALCWGIGIVATNSDWAFTVTN
ncbi:MAG: hypothetical protein AAFN74_19075, partial [Myxococcota bacterium]